MKLKKAVGGRDIVFDSRRTTTAGPWEVMKNTPLWKRWTRSGSLSRFHDSTAVVKLPRHFLLFDPVDLPFVLLGFRGARHLPSSTAVQTILKLARLLTKKLEGVVHLLREWILPSQARLHPYKESTITFVRGHRGEE